MLAHANWYFHAYGYEKGSEVTRIAQWRQVKKSTGYEPEGLKNKPKVSDDALNLWGLYVDIKSGCNSVTYSELASYQLMVCDISAFEAELMIKTDNIRKNHAY